MQRLHYIALSGKRSTPLKLRRNSMLDTFIALIAIFWICRLAGLVIGVAREVANQT